MKEAFTAKPATRADSKAIVDLIDRQEKRWHALDPRLRPPRPYVEIEKTVQKHLRESDDPPIVVRNAQGNIRGYALPSLWEVWPGNEGALHAFAARNGDVESLTLPASDEAAYAVAGALLDAIQVHWRRWQTQSESCRWPTLDTWLDGLLRSAGFDVLMYTALRAPGPLPSALYPAPLDLTIRPAIPADEDVLVELYLEICEYHTHYGPFFRMVPTLGPDFRKQLAAAWKKEVRGQAPLVFVAEWEGSIVAMTYISFFQVGAGSLIDYLPPGRYAELVECGVRAGMRGKGIGRVLVQKTMEACDALGIQGYTLNYSPHNPLSNQFWPHLGFHPYWTIYQRRHDDMPGEYTGGAKQCC